MNLENLFPYLSRDPEWPAICIPIGSGWHRLPAGASRGTPAGSRCHPEPIGRGLFAQLVEDRESEEGLVHTPVTPQQLRIADLTAEVAHQIALDNLIAFADESPALSIQMLGKPGDPVNFILYSDHARASACLRLPDLYEHSRELLEASELCACVPQRESLVVFPKRDRAYRAMLVEKLRAIEADARHPLGFDLFALAPGTVTPFTEPE